MKKFQKSPNCHRCTINYAYETIRCNYCNLGICMPCYFHYLDFNAREFQMKYIHRRCGFIEVVCYNCQEYQRVMNKIDCWLTIHR